MKGFSIMAMYCSALMSFNQLTNFSEVLHLAFGLVVINNVIHWQVTFSMETQHKHTVYQKKIHNNNCLNVDVGTLSCNAAMTITFRKNILSPYSRLKMGAVRSIRKSTRRSTQKTNINPFTVATASNPTHCLLVNNGSHEWLCDTSKWQTLKSRQTLQFSLISDVSSAHFQNNSISCPLLHY